MAKLNVFLFATLDGYLHGPGGDISWHRHDAEGARFSEEQLASGGVLLFGRKTYEMMASFWPTPDAAEAFPQVARGMSEAEKVVFSRRKRRYDWENTRVAERPLLEEVRAMKRGRRNLTVLGSGSIVTQLADAGLVDTLELLVDPIALGGGTSLFEGLTHPLELRLEEARAFPSGSVLLRYRR